MFFYYLSLISFRLFFHFFQERCALQTISAQSSETSPDNLIRFDWIPDKVADGSVVRVRFQCSRPCQLAVDVVVSTLRKTDLVVFRRKWINGSPRVPRIQQVLLRLPRSISHHHDFFSRTILDAQNVTVRAWLDHLKKGSEMTTYKDSMLRIYTVLQVTALSNRPHMPPTACPSWSAQLMWLLRRNKIHQCPREEG